MAKHEIFEQPSEEPRAMESCIAEAFMRVFKSQIAIDSKDSMVKHLATAHVPQDDAMCKAYE